MKRIMSVILAVAMLSVLALMPVSAANEYAIKIENTAATVTVGDTFELVITVDSVATGSEINFVEFDVAYDASLLQAGYVQSSTSDNTRFSVTPGDTEWEHMVQNSTGNQYCVLMSSDLSWNASTGVTASAISKGDTLTFTLPFTVLDAAAGESVTVTVKNVVAYDATDMVFETPLSAANATYTFTAAGKASPITTIGSKINTVAPALRLGAQYDASQLEIARKDVKDIGIVFYPSRLLAGAELNYNTEGAMKLSAQGIEGYVDGNTFVDYDSFIFYVTIVNIPANGMDDLISYRAYLQPKNGELVHAENTYERSYNYVYDTLFPSIGTGSGDNAILPDNGWFE